MRHLAAVGRYTGEVQAPRSRQPTTGLPIDPELRCDTRPASARAIKVREDSAAAANAVDHRVERRVSPG